jgi:2'-5' RNA ligase
MDLIRTFVSVEIPEKFSEQIINIQKELEKTKPDIKWVEPENFHFNLKFLGSRTEAEIAKISEKTKAVASKHKKFALSIERMGCFPSDSSPRVVWLGVKQGADEISTLAGDIDESCSKLGIEKEKRKFEPHLTLGRIRSPKNQEALVKKINENRNIQIGTFKVSKILLMQSKLSPKGPTYSILGKYDLCD